ncbi:MAG TPA: hypothetical protein VH142_07705 [Polyangiaceae bacterium]|jgi:hypothetical protein|nr:hypothetical protein [Polyangiaceae bacterium]
MTKVVDVLSVVLLAGAAVAFALGIRALGDERDLAALYWLVAGALLLRSSTDLLRPKPESR